MKRFGKALVALWRKDDGTATMEFVLMVPVLLAVFLAAFESGLLMVRHTMLDRAVDMTVREVRLGHMMNATHDTLKDMICDHTVVIPNCRSVIRIEMEPISTTTWALPDESPTCIDRAETIHPVTTVNPGLAEEIMLVRVCVVADAMFPTTGIGLGLPKDGNGGYRLIAVSAFVNEP